MLMMKGLVMAAVKEPVVLLPAAVQGPVAATAAVSAAVVTLVVTMTLVVMSLGILERIDTARVEHWPFFAIRLFDLFGSAAVKLGVIVVEAAAAAVARRRTVGSFPGRVRRRGVQQGLGKRPFVHHRRRRRDGSLVNSAAAV